MTAVSNVTLAVKFSQQSHSYTAPPAKKRTTIPEVRVNFITVSLFFSISLYYVQNTFLKLLLLEEISLCTFFTQERGKIIAFLKGIIKLKLSKN